MNKQTALEIFDGVMLGDAGLDLHGRNARFCISLSRGGTAELVDYLSYVKYALLVKCVSVCQGYPGVFESTSKGKPYSYCRLRSRTSPLLTEEYLRWYPHGRKAVPADIELTPVVLAHWYMGDGCSSRDNRNMAVDVSLSTYGFRGGDIVVLEGGLHHLDLLTGRKRETKVHIGDGIVITILQDSVNKFMDMISPHMIEPYMYKIKYRDKMEVG